MAVVFRLPAAAPRLTVCLECTRSRRNTQTSRLDVRCAGIAQYTIRCSALCLRTSNVDHIGLLIDSCSLGSLSGPIFCVLPSLNRLENLSTNLTWKSNCCVFRLFSHRNICNVREHIFFKRSNAELNSSLLQHLIKYATLNWTCSPIPLTLCRDCVKL